MVLKSQAAMAQKVENQRTVYEIANSEAIAVSSMATICGVIVFLLVLLEIVKPLKKTSKKLGEIINAIENGQGDLQERVSVTGKDEIGQLADSSRNTANNIQDINQIVIAAVKELIQTANELVKYINE